MSTVSSTRLEGAVDASFDHDAFISYRRGDGRAMANWLRRRLQSYRLPPKLEGRGLPPIKAYLDTTFERASDDFWTQNIEPALKRSRYLLVLVTPSVFTPRTDGEQSWVDREIETFLALPQGRNVLVAVAGGNQLDRIPQLLRDRFPRIDVVDLNGTGGRFGLAQRSYLNDQTLTLIASICRISDVDMPLLRREEERRKRTLAIRVTSGALILVAVLATLLVFALIQRKVAVTQRTNAETRRVEAEKAQADAEAQRNLAEDRQRQADAAKQLEQAQRIEAERQKTIAQEQRSRAQAGQISAEARSLGLAALSDFAAGRQTQALLEAVEGGRKLESLQAPHMPLTQYSVTTPLLALNTVLDTVHERNRLEHSENTVACKEPIR